MTLKRPLKIAFCLILLLAAHAAAQLTPTALTGKISNFNGDGVRNATITITSISKKTKFKQTTTSDEAGKYLFPRIPPGLYRIAATDSNGLTYQNPSFDVPANQTTRLDLRIEYGGDCVSSGVGSLTLNDANKANILNEMLRDVLLKKRIAEYDRLKNQQAGVVLSIENIKAEWLKPLKNMRFSALSDAEIRQKAAGDNQFMYLSFGEFKLKGNCVITSVSNLWAADPKSRKTPTGGGGRIFVFNKKGGKFKIKTSGGWNF